MIKFFLPALPNHNMATDQNPLKSLDRSSHVLHYVCNMYLQDWAIFVVNVGKYSSTMQHLDMFPGWVPWQLRCGIPASPGEDQKFRGGDSSRRRSHLFFLMISSFKKLRKYGIMGYSNIPNIPNWCVFIRLWHINQQRLRIHNFCGDCVAACLQFRVPR